MGRGLLFFLLLMVSKVVFSFDTHRMSEEVVSSYEGMPSSIVNGVNVITGEYLVNDEDISLNTVDPFTFSRYYSSLLPGPEPFFDFWADNHECTFQIEDIFKGRSDITVGEHSGGCRRFLGNCRSNKARQDERAYRHGYTNTGCGEISAKYNPENYQFQFHARNAKVTKGDGTQLHYFCPSDFLACTGKQALKKERLPTGRELHYEYYRQPHTYYHKLRNDMYDKRSHFKEIRLTSPNGKKTLGWIKNTFDSRTHSYSLTSSEGHDVFLKRRVKNNYMCLKERVLDSVSNNFGVHVSYKYKKSKARFQDSFHRLTSIEKPEARLQLISYYDDRPQSYNFGRVRSLSSRFENNQKPQLTHRFEYKFKYGDGSYFKNEVKEGTTIVYDAYDNKTTYQFDTCHRLDKVEKYLDNSLYTTEKMKWSNSKSIQSGRLLSKTLSDSNNKVLKQLLYTYDDAGNVICKTLLGNLCAFGSQDKYQESYTYSNDGFNLLETITKGSGLQVIKTYLKDTNLITSEIQLFDSKIVQRHFWEYDEDGFLTKEVIDDGNTMSSTNLSGLSFRKTLSYTLKTTLPALGKPIQITESFYDPNIGTERTLRFTKLSYNSRGLTTKEEIFGEQQGLHTYSFIDYTVLGKPSKIQTQDGDFIFEYDANGNQTKILDPLGHTIHKTYDCSNRLIEEYLLDSKTGEKRESKYEYDLKNCLVNKINTYGHTQSFTYDSLGRKTSETLLNQKFFTYDSLNHLTSEFFSGEKGIQTSFNILDAPVRRLYPDGSEELYEYQTWGGEKKYVDRLGNSTEYTLDWQGRKVEEKTFSKTGRLIAQIKRMYNAFHLLSEEDIQGNRTEYIYDFAGRLSKYQTRTSNGELTSCVEKSYDNFDRVIRESTYSSASDGIHIDRSYDVHDKPIEEITTGFNGTPISHIKRSFDLFGRLLEESTLTDLGWSSYQYSYNAWGEIISSKDPMGNITKTSYSKTLLGQLVTVTDPKDQVTYTQFNAHGKTLFELKKGSKGDLLSRVESTYDARDRKSKEEYTVLKQGSAQRSFTCLYTYNEEGLLLSVDRNGQHTTHSYENGLLKELVQPNGIKLSYTYTPLALVESVQSSDGTVYYRYSYDTLGNLILIEDILKGTQTERDFDSQGRVIREKLATGYETKSLYNYLGQPTQLILADGSLVNYSYEATQLSSVERGKYKHQYTAYSINSLVKEESLPAKLGIREYHQDLMQRLIKIEGKIPAEIRYDNIGAVEYYQCRKQQIYYQYDPLYQLRSEGKYEYSYDSIHNRCSKGEALYEVNSLNQVLYDGVFCYTYDLNGNMVRKEGQGKKWVFSYDALNRLIKLETSKGKSIEYSYDAFNRLLKKGQTAYLYLDSKEYGEIDSSGRVRSLRVFAGNPESEIGNSVLVELEGTVYVPIHDPFGHIIEVLDTKSGRSVDSMEYTAFGEVSRLRALTCPWGFCGKRLDEDLDLNNFGQRYYSATLGRWVTQDPIGGGDGPNLYAYVHNNPLSHHDSYGLYDENSGSIPQEDFLSRIFNVKEYTQNILDLPCRVATLGLSDKLGITNEWGSSSVTDLGRPELKSGGIGFICGMNMTRGEAIEAGEYLSDLSGGINIRLVPTYSRGAVRDTVTCLKNTVGLFSPEEHRLASTWMHYLNTRQDDTPYLQVGFSRGCIILRNTLAKMPESIRQEINVLAISPGVCIDKKLCKELAHFCSKSDLVPKLNSLALRKAEKQGTVVYLPAHPEASSFDHSYKSPTFSPYIKDYLEGYISTWNQ